MSTVKRECRVVMLPTEKASYGKYLVLNKEGKLCIWDTDKMGSQKTSAIQHLYILSDDEIKAEGILCYYENYLGGGKIICKSHITPNGEIVFHELGVNLAEYYGTADGGITPLPGECCRIIATTDVLGVVDKDLSKSMGGKVERRLPQPSQAFIQKYIDAYNSGKPIEKVMVDYVKYPDGFDLEDGTQFSYSLKINQKDNTIIISKVKDSWTREEVSDLVRKAILDYSTGCSIPSNKWIEENLK